MMSEPIILHIPVSEEYDALYAQAREQAGLRKCRCWFDRTAAIGEIRVEITGRDIAIRYETKKGHVEERCVYSAVPSMTELHRGIALRLSHGRMLFLPVGGNRDYMLNLMRAVELMEPHIAYRFQDCSMALPGIGFYRRITFRMRSKRGMPFSLHRVTGAVRAFIIAVICGGILMGTVMVTYPLFNRRVEIEDTRQIHGILTDIDGIYGRSGLSSIRLTFAGGETWTVNECSSALLSELEALPDRAELTIWVHPGAAGVLQIQSQNGLLLEFEEAMESAWTNACLLAGLGVLVYAGCGYIWYDVFWKKR